MAREVVRDARQSPQVRVVRMTCLQCFRGDYWDLPFMCGDCERAAEDAEREAAEFAFWDELEFERDQAFDALIESLESAHVSR